MNKYAVLFEYFRTCPLLSDLLSIAAQEEKGNTVILPAGASPVVQYIENINVSEEYECRLEPYPSVYEDFQINCYRAYNTRDTSNPSNNVNVLTYEDVLKICEWIKEQDLKGNYPQIGEKIVSIECYPFVPQVRYVNEQENIVCYYITVRLRYVNRTERRWI